MARSELQVDDGVFRVTEWVIEPGGAIPPHRHEYDYVVVPLTAGEVRAVGPDGSVVPMTLRVGGSYARAAGAEHTLENRGSAEVRFVEVERL
jgi:quercetin dioxygenase-like cupin family protein